LKSNSRNEIIETRLDNGLGLLLKEDHTAPIASIWTWYRVGSRNEVPGKTGISHWVEHMQFKGTPTLEKGQIFRDVSRVGGTLNAMTSHDWTAYFETVPSAEVDLPLRIESDRMTNSLFDPAEVESERTVILSERQGSENHPGYELYEEVVGSAFRAHPYRHMVIGYENDLRQITRDDLYAHYRQYYHPANAFIVAVGDFHGERLLEQIETRFREIPGGAPIPLSIGISEPSQLGERRVLLRRPAGAPYLRMGFHAPAADDDDLVPLLVADAVFSGGKPMGFGGGGAMGRSSRLYRALVASGLARSASSDMSITIDPFLFQFGVTALPGGDLARIEAVIDEEVRRLHNETVPTDELDRAIRQVEAQFVYSSEGVTNQAYWLGQWDIVDRWTHAGTLPAEMRKVTADDITRVSRSYLVPERRTVGWLEPEGDGGSREPDIAPSGFAIWDLGGPTQQPASTATGFQRTALPNGIVILGQDRPTSESIALRMRVPAGSIHERDDESGLAYLTARSMARGSGGRSFEQINTRTDQLGSSLSIDIGREFVEARIRCLRDDLPEMAELLAQTLLLPEFPEDEVERVKAEQLGAISEADNDTRATADRLMRRGVYPAPNPFGRRLLGTSRVVQSFDREAVRAFQSRVFGGPGATIAIVGATGGFDETADLLAKAFEAWSSSPRAQAVNAADAVSTSTTRTNEEIAGKSQADVALGIATISRRHEDYYALDLANLILGRLGLMGRLGAHVRDRQGLAYYAYSQIEPRNDGSLWVARAGVDPGNVERAIEATRAELERVRNEPVTDDELRDAKSYSIGVLPLALETHDGVAATLLAIEEFGLGLDYLERYPRIIEDISREAIQAAAQRHLDLERIAIGVAAPPGN
jgi:zinc protease